MKNNHALVRINFSLFRSAVFFFPGVLFIFLLVSALPLLIEEIFWKTDSTFSVTKYIFLCYAIFFIVFIGLVVPSIRKVFNYLRLKINLDGVATILIMLVSFTPLFVLAITTITLLRKKSMFKHRYRIINFSVSVSIFLLGAWVNYHGKRDKRARIVIANHTSLLDYFLIIRAMGPDPFNVLAGINLSRDRKGFFNKLLARSVGQLVKDYAIAVDREDKASKANSVLQMISELENGKNIAIFPEGTRTREELIKEGTVLSSFYPGAFGIAWDLKTPIQLVVFDFPVMWKGKNKKKFGIHPCSVNMHFMDVVDPKDYASMELFQEECRFRMEQKLKNSKNVKRFLKR